MRRGASAFPRFEEPPIWLEKKIVESLEFDSFEVDHRYFAV